MRETRLKVKGSTVLWTLHNKQVAAYTIWTTAQLFDRTVHGGKATGRIHHSTFIPWAAKHLHLKEPAIKRWIKKAERYKFLIRSEHDNWYISSHRVMVGHCLDDQQRRFENGETKITPKMLISEDREYTRKAYGHLIHPSKPAQTRRLLTSIALSQGSFIARGVSNHTKYLKCARSTVQRSSNEPYVVTQERFLVLDVVRLPIGGSAKPGDIAQAIVDAEQIYQQAGYAPPGRRRFLRQFDKLRQQYAVMMQLPNGYSCTYDEKVVRARREGRAWLRVAGLSARAKSVSARGNAVPPNQSQDRAQASKTRTGAALVPERTIEAYQYYFHDMLECDEVRDHIKAATGATGLRDASAVPAYVWVPKAAAYYAAPNSAPPTPGFIRVVGTGN